MYMYIYKNLLPYSRAWIRQTKYIVMIKERFTKILYFITPGAGVPVLRRGHTKSFFSKNLVPYFWAWVRQTKCIVMMTKERSTKIVIFMTPVAEVFVLRRAHISHIVIIHYCFKYLNIYSWSWIRQSHVKVTQWYT